MNAAAASPPPTNQSPVAQAVNAVANAASSAVTAVSNAASGTVNTVVNAANNILGNPVSANNKKNAGMSFNSLIPLGNSSPPAANSNQANKNRGNGAAPNNRGNGAAPNNRGNGAAPNNRGNGAGANNRGNGAGANMSSTNSSANKPANAGANKPANVGVNNAPPTTFGDFSVTKLAESPWAYPLGIFAGLVVIFLIAFAVFNKQIKQGYEYVTGSFQQSMGLSSQPSVVAPVIPIHGDVREVTVPPMPPQSITPSQHSAANQSIVEKVLPSNGPNEVYNISQNKFTYYDAEPLCKALGAELASYEQVKEAWTKGADWCNYGWVKGQMAVYPTQKDTYDKLQSGPADERMACGTTGINGGFFDNPDMLYGVNCYGKKPSQSSHDEQKLMEQGKVPKSPAALKVDQMVNEFKAEADSLYVKPFSDAKWSSA
jgi:hypothetical protein